MPVLPRTAREIRLAAVPDGLPRPEDFTVVQTPLPVPGEGEVLVRNRFFHVFAALRTVIGGGLNGAPLPPLHPGETLFGAAVGEVVSAPGGSGLCRGDLVSHWRGWREYAVLAAAECSVLADDLPDPAAHLAQGWTAYSALTLGAELRPGDTVFVSGGGGSVGSLAGQIARLLGAGRVIGSTSSHQKAARLRSELGYDATVIRGAGPVAGQLSRAAPDGIDVFLDNVGGEQLQAAVTAGRPGARFVLVGALSGQLATRGAGAAAPAELDSFQVILKQITMRGFSAPHDPQARSEWTGRFGAWLRSGDITFPHVRITGIDHAPRAFQEMVAGQHLGTVIVEL